jgi:glycosyltransferase involved in cell wall biosynthesis
LATRVAFVLPDLNGGGAERAVLELAAESRLDCSVLTERPGGQLTGHPLAAGVECLHLPGGRLRRVAGLAHAVRRRRIEVLVSALSPVVVTAAGRSAGVPAIAWIQNPLHEVVRLLPGATRPRTQACAARLVGGAAAAIATAAPGLRDEWRRAGVSTDRLCVLPNGTRLPMPCDTRPDTGAGELRMLSVGRLAPQKRHDIAIAALAELRSRDCPTHLEILGTGEQERALREHAARLGVGAHVTFAGFVGDPSPRYRAADVLVLASDFEGFGNVLVEALAHGLAVVATDAPFGPRFILDGLDGARLVPRGDPVAVADAVSNVVEEHRARPSLGAEARQRAMRFSVTRSAEHFERIVDAVLGDGPLPEWTTSGSAHA